MIKSMTGYGTALASNDEISVSVDIRAVNSRYLDMNFRLPSSLYPYENSLKNKIKSTINRGKLDVYIKVDNLASGESRVVVSRELLEDYLRSADALAGEYDIENDLALSHFIGNTNIFTLVALEEEDAGECIFDLTKQALDEALAIFLESRTTEGAELYNDLIKKLDFIDMQVNKAKSSSAAYNDELKTYYFNRVKELADDFKVHEDRLYTEVALLIDKHCIDEEVVRLDSHTKQFREILDMDDAVGKRLDFLVQEMNRESNTILSKSKSVELTSIGLSIKTEVEKIREQIQNIE